MIFWKKLSADELKEKGDKNHAQGNYQDALKCYTNAISKNPQFARAYNNRGNTKKNLNDFKGSFDDYLKASEIDPTLPHPFHNLGRSKIELGDYVSAIDYFTKSINVDDSILRSESYRLRGYSKLEINDSQNGLVDVEKSLEIDPNNIESIGCLSYAKYKCDQPNEALIFAEEALKLNPDCKLALLSRALCRALSGDDHGVISDLDQVLDESLSYIGFFCRGCAKKNIEDYEGAINDFNCAKNINPELAWTYYHLALSKFFINKAEEAIIDINKGIEIESDNAEFFYRRGYVQFFLEKYEEAKSDFSKAADLGSSLAMQVLSKNILDFETLCYLEIDNEENFVKDTTRNTGITDKDFISYWDLIEFRDFLKKGLEIGSKYFFLIKNVGIFLYLRDTNYKAMYSREREGREFLIYAEEFDANKLNEAESSWEKEYSLLSEKSNELYKGDFCEWFQLSDQLLNEINEKLKEGFTKLKVTIKKPLLVIEENLENSDESEDKIFCHNQKIDQGGACPVSPFNSKIFLEYFSVGKRQSLLKKYNCKELFITASNAREIINKDNSEDYSHYIEILLESEKAEDSNKLDQAILLISNAVDKYPQWAQAYFKRARLYRQLNQIDKAVADYDKCININPDDFKAYVNRGIAKSDGEDFEAAIKDLEEGLKINPQDKIGLFWIARTKFITSDYEAVINHLNDFIKIEKDDPDCFLLRAKAKLKINDIDSAIKDLEKAIEIDPESGDALYKLGDTHYQKENYEKALNYFEKCIKLYPNISPPYSMGGLSYYFLEDYKKAENYLQKVIELDSATFSTYKLLSETQEKQDKFNDALSSIDQAIKIKKDDFYLYIARGSLKEKLGDKKGQIKDLKKALKFINQNDPDAYFNLALDFDKANQDEIALTLYDKTIELNPNDWEAFRNKGLIHRYNDDDKALADFKRSIKIKSDEANLHFYIGEIYCEQEDYKKGMIFLNKAIELGTDINEVYRERAYAKGNIDDDKGAIDDFLKFLEFEPDEAEIMESLSNCYLRVENFTDALKHCEKAIEIGKENPNYYSLDDFYLLRSEIHKALGELKKSKEDFIKSKTLEFNTWISIAKKSNEGSSYKKCGDIQQELDDIKAAIKYWKKAADLGDEEAKELYEDNK